MVSPGTDNAQERQGEEHGPQADSTVGENGGRGQCVDSKNAAVTERLQGTGRREAKAAVNAGLCGAEVTQ